MGSLIEFKAQSDELCYGTVRWNGQLPGLGVTVYACVDMVSGDLLREHVETSFVCVFLGYTCTELVEVTYSVVGILAGSHFTVNGDNTFCFS